MNNFLAEEIVVFLNIFKPLSGISAVIDINPYSDETDGRNTLPKVQGHTSQSIRTL